MDLVSVVALLSCLSMSLALVEEYLKKSQVKLLKYLDTLNALRENREGCSSNIETEPTGTQEKLLENLVII